MAQIIFEHMIRERGLAHYFEIDSDGLGMQMNADHDIVDSELTEFS
jgi:hypothetical protein